jgi:hypothetical protein
MIEYLPVNQQGNYTLLIGYGNYAKGVKIQKTPQKSQLFDFQCFIKLTRLN